MTQPVQEPSQGRTDQAQEFRTRQLFRRPAPPGPGTIHFGLQYCAEDVSVDDVPPFLLTLPSFADNWLLFDAVASVQQPPTVGDLAVQIYPIIDCSSGGTPLFDNVLTIDQDECDSRTSSSPFTITPGQYISEGTGGIYTQLEVTNYNFGCGAFGLVILLAFGVERIAGSGVH